MKREPFLAQLQPLDADGLRQLLWNLYWRAPAAFRERIEGEIRIGRGAPRPKKAKAAAVDSWCVGQEVEEFCDLARSGAYIGGTRAVSPKERSRWRFTLRRLHKEGADALESLIDLTCEACDYAYFRSDDPVSAARVVVSDQVSLLWRSSLHQEGLKGFARRSAPQLLRWETPYGWARHGDGPVVASEVSLSGVGRDAAGEREQRAQRLSRWHDRLLDVLSASECDGSGDRLGRLVRHRALAGPEARYLEARLARLRGEDDRARSLIAKSLRKLPGHQDFQRFAAKLGMTEQDWRAAPAAGG